jgi:hypothetical protein
MSAQADVIANITDSDIWTVVSSKKQPKVKAQVEIQPKKHDAIKKPDVYLNTKLKKLTNTSCSSIPGKVYYYIVNLLKTEPDIYVIINTVKMIGYSNIDKLLCLTMLFQICVRQEKASLMQRIIDGISDSDRKFMVNAYDRKYTPLMQAAYNGSVSSVKLLLIWNANVDEINIDGEDISAAIDAGLRDQIKKTPLLEIFLIPKFQEIHTFIKAWKTSEDCLKVEAPIDFKASKPEKFKLIKNLDDSSEEIAELSQLYIDDYNKSQLTVLFEEINELIVQGKISKDIVRTIIEIHMSILQEDFKDILAILKI